MTGIAMEIAIHIGQNAWLKEQNQITPADAEKLAQKRCAVHAARTAETAMATLTAKTSVMVAVTREPHPTTQTVTPGQHATPTPKRATTAATAAAAA